MENNNDPIEIFIKTMKPESNKKVNSGLEEGTTKTAGTLDMLYDPIAGAVKTKLQREVQHEDKTPILETVLQKVNEVTAAIVDNLSQNFDNKNVSKLEVEFGISFRENLKLYIFEAGAEQSIKFKVTLEK